MARPARPRRRTGPPRCDLCHRPIVVFTNPHLGTGSMAFDPRQVNGRTFAGGEAYPVENLRAWRVRDLVEDLMVRRSTSEAEAQAEVYAMPWHPVHRCAQQPTSSHHGPDAATRAGGPDR